MVKGEAYTDLMKNLKAGKFVFTGEIEPVKTTKLDEIIEAAKVLKDCVIACNITDNPTGLAYMNSLIPSYIMQRETGLEAIYQITCRDRNRIAIFSDLLAAAAVGIRNILALTGDHSALGDMPEAKPVFDIDSQQLVYMIRKMVDEGVDLNGHPIENPPKFNVGVGAVPTADPLEPEIIKLERKEDVGADYVQTQVVYDIEIAKSFMKAVSHIKMPILIGITPLKSIGMAKWMIQNLPGVIIPDEVMERLEKAKEKSKEAFYEENINLFAEFTRELKKTTHAAGVHIMAIGIEWMTPKIIERSGIKTNYVKMAGK